MVHERIFNHVTLLSTSVLIAGFAIVSTRHYMVHARISLDVDLELHVVFVSPKKGMSSAQSSMRLKKVCPETCYSFMHRGFSTLVPSYCSGSAENQSHGH